MKRVYLIFFILLFTGCGGAQPAELTERPSLTIPPEWLTKLPTPEITAETVDQPSTLAGSSAATVSPEVAATSERVTTEPTQSPTGTPGFHLPRRLGRQWTMSAAPGVPKELILTARTLASERPDDFLWVEPGSVPTDITLKVSGQEQLADWLYVVAAPFATLEDDLTEVDLIELWSAAEASDRSMVLSADEIGLFRDKWGDPGANVSVVDKADLVDTLWALRPSLTILPIQQLTPELKVLRVESESPFNHEFAANEYPLSITMGVNGEQDALTAFTDVWDGQETNYDPEKLTTVAMTGVTALVRATATQMEIDGILAPAVDIGSVLRAADIAHISNEVSFTPNCPEPNPIGGTSFCSQDEYFALLEEIGADVIELTGNHLNDWGADNVGRSIDMYEEAGMDYFGGGRDVEDAARAAIFEHNGNSIAMVGCNSFGPVYAWAMAATAGSRACGPEFYEQIEQLKDEGHLVIATQQYAEYYQYPPTPDQEYDFQRIADAGAAAVSGSQGHHAQGFDFHNGAFIHYGLGNLFFDQMDMIGTRQAFVDIYNIYDGRLINIDLWTGLIENYSTPREMNTTERQQALQSVFQASGW